MFYMPSRLYTGIDCLKKNAKALEGLGKKALLVTGKSSALKNGSQKDVVEVLESLNKTFEVFNQIEENPSIETVMKARDFGLLEGWDFVIGIGGGSPMDAAKAIALMMKHKEAGWEYLYDSKAASDTLPIVCIPTTCGTGSEATAVSVLTRTDLLTKKSSVHKLFPTMSFIDGKYLKSAPKSILNNTAMDALAHMYEGVLHSKATDYTWLCAKTGLELWKKNKDFLLGKREGEDADYQRLMDASTMAGMTIAQTGTTIPHSLSYPVTIRLGIPHGKAVSYFQAAYLKEAKKEDRDRLLLASGFTDPDQMHEFFLTLCQPEKISEEVLEIAVSEVKANEKKLAAVPFAVDESVIRRIAGFMN